MPFAAPDCTPEQLDPPQSSFEVDPAARQRQADALRGMSLEAIEYSPRGPIEHIAGVTGIVLPPDAQFRLEGGPASDLLPLFKDLLLATGTETLTVRQHREHIGTERSLRLEQSIAGIPVLGGVLGIGYDASSRQVKTVVAHFVPGRDLPRTPRLTAREAEQVVPRALSRAENIDASGIAVLDGTHLGYFAEHKSSEPVRLVWVVQVGGSWEQEEFYVDALTGVVAHRRPLSTSSAGRKPPPDVTGARCECAGKSYSPAKRMRRVAECGRVVGMNWSEAPDVDRYVGEMALPDLGWAFSDLVIDHGSLQCACELPMTAMIRIRGCNSCGCGPWSKGQLIEVKNPCPPPNEAPSD